MKKLAVIVAALGIALFAAAQFSQTGWARVSGKPTAASALLIANPAHADSLNAVIARNCATCHSERLRTGNLSLTGYDITRASSAPDISESIVNKLHSQMMPPPGARRPGGDTLAMIIDFLESHLDSASAANPNPGGRSFQRLNRAEYSAAIRELLQIEIDASAYLPLDTKSENFDNVADVQTLSPMLLDAYLRAAGEISWLAVGNPRSTPSEATYSVTRTASQMTHVAGAPFGTRGGLSVVHTFPADGTYSFAVSFYHETTGAFAGGNIRGEQLEISVDGARVVLLDIDRFMNASDPNGVAMATLPVPIKAGPRRISAAFISPSLTGVVQDLISPLKWSLNSTSNATAYGFTLVPHLRDLVIRGPTAVTGVSDSPVRSAIFTCRPTSPSDARSCAGSIISRLAMQAYRRPLTASDTADLMRFYDAGVVRGAQAVAAAASGATGGAAAGANASRAAGATATAAAGAAANSDQAWENGVRTALEAILASPDFVFRLERVPTNVRGGESYRVSDVDLASRLSFFLWSGPPDSELLRVATAGTLSHPAEYERQVRRMLADPRSASLGSRFAAQWLRLSDIEKVQPDVRQYPDFDEQLRSDMRQETEVFFHNLVAEDRSVLDLWSADYTFVNERLAQHYGVRNVAGNHFRRVPYPDDRRRGLMGHGSILTLTSHATRTSAVDRGKWVMEVFLNSPPPPPPPGVPDLEATPETSEGRVLTVRERMEQHRNNAACRSCHLMMDPIGLALENFDATGQWRVRDNGMPIDSRGQLWDGTQVESLVQLSTALLKRPEPLLRTFTRNLMAYALGRRVEHYDMPTIRAITQGAAVSEHKMSAYIMGVVKSPAFQMQSTRVNDAQQRSP